MSHAREEFEAHCSLLSRVFVGARPGDYRSRLADLAKENISVQIQACLVATLATTCLFCDDGLRSASCLLEKLFTLASVNSARREGRVVQEYVPFVQSYPGRSSSLLASLALLSVADHSRHSTFVEDADGGEPRSARAGSSSAAESTTDTELVMRALETFSAVHTMAAVWPLVSRGDKGIDWLSVVANHAASIGSLTGLSPDVRLLPMHIAACARLSECGEALMGRAAWIVSAAMSVLCAKRLVAGSSKGCAVHVTGRSFRRSAVCIKKISVHDEVAMELYRGVGTKDRRRSIHGWTHRRMTRIRDKASCCSRAPYHAKISRALDSDDLGQLEAAVAEAYAALEEKDRDLVAAAREAGIVTHRARHEPQTYVMQTHTVSSAKRFRGRAIKLAAARDREADGPVFGGPIVFVDLFECLPRQRLTESPRYFFCTLQRDIESDGEVMKAGSTALVRGPFYRHIDRSDKQIRTLFSGCRLMAYLNEFKRRWGVAGVEHFDFCAVIRAPIVQGCASGDGADFLDGLLGIREEEKARLAPDLTYPDKSAESLRVSAVQRDGFLASSVCPRDVDGSLPMWLVISDFTGDYRAEPWRMMIHLNRNTLSSSFERMRRNIYRAEIGLPRHIVPQIDVETLGAHHTSNVSHPAPWQIGHYAVRGCAASNILAERMMCAITFRAVFGVSRTVLNRDMFVSNYKPFGPTEGVCVLLPCDFVYTEPRYPVFDANKRHNLPRVYLGASSKREPKMFKSGGKQYTRAQRAAFVLKELREVSIPFARGICEFQRAVARNPEALIPSTLSKLLPRLRIGKTASKNRMGSNDNVKFGCLFTPATPTSYTWYPIVGDHFYMVASLLGLDPDIFGYNPQLAFSHMLWTPAELERRDRYMTMHARMFLWARSISENRPLFREAFDPATDPDMALPMLASGYGRSECQRIKQYDPSKDRGWLLLDGNAERMAATVESWGSAVQSEIERLKASGRAETDGRRKRSRKAAAADDTKPDWRWIEHKWLPMLGESCAATARTLRDLAARQNLWDALEWLHGKDALVGFLYQINNHLIIGYNKIIDQRRRVMTRTRARR